MVRLQVQHGSCNSLSLAGWQPWILCCWGWHFWPWRWDMFSRRRSWGMLTNVLSASHAVPSQPFGQIPKCCTSRATGHAWLVDTGLSVKVRRNRRRMMRNRSGSALVTSYISNSFCESIRLSRLMQATGRNASSLRFAHACKLAIRRLCPTRLLVFGHGEICAQERLCLLASPRSNTCQQVHILRP